MTPETVLVRAECDLKRLPLDALEAFLLSQLDGQLTLAEVGEIAGLDAQRAERVATRLVELGAARQKQQRDPRAETGVRRRLDPRAEEEETPPPVDKTAPRSRRSSASLQATRRRSTRSLRAARVASPPPASKPVEPCELDALVQDRILSLEKLSTTVDHYTLLGVARDADRKDIKRAYFALAAELHPDRFFGKKLGHVRAPLDRLFVRLTEANDTLGKNVTRAEYDALLPPLRPRISRPPKAPTKAPPSMDTGRRTKAPPSMDAGSKTKAPPSLDGRRTKAPPSMETGRRTKAPPSMPEPRVSKAPPSMPKRTSSRRMSKAMRAVTPPPAPAKPGAGPDEKFQRLQQAAKMLAAQTRAEPLVRAAEERLKANDIVGAANNFRLALGIFEDPDVRRKLEAIDAHSKDIRHDASVARARLAERGERWAEAADHYLRAHQARPDAATAERAANALRIANGDLKLAASLAEQALAKDERSIDYRLTLAEVYFTGGFAVRAAGEVETILARDPQNPRAKLLDQRLKERR